MKVKQVSVEFHFTKSLPNYQNVRPTAGVVIELEDGDTVEDAYKYAWEIVGQQVSKQLELFELNPKSVQKGLK